MPRPTMRPRFSPLRLARTLAFCALLPAPLLAPPASSAQPARPRPTDTLFTGATTQYDQALKDRVDKVGLLDYAKLKGDTSLAAFVAALPGVDVSKFPAFEVAASEGKEDAPGRKPAKKPGQDKKKGPDTDRSWELAFWINAHNALAVKTLADAYPIGSPDEVKDFTTRKFPVAGGEYTLGEIRDKATQIDPRATFAMIDGTKDGPKMAPRALRALTINDTLESAVKAVIDDPNLVTLQRIDNRVSVAPFLATVDETWKPRTATRKWDGIRYLLSSYTSAGPSRNYYTTNRYDILLATGSRRLNVIPSTFAG